MTNPIDKAAQPEALRLAAWLNEGCWHQIRLGDVEAAGRELRRLHALTVAQAAQIEACRAEAARWQATAESALQLVKINQEGAELVRSLGLDEPSMKEKTP